MMIIRFHDGSDGGASHGYSETFLTWADISIRAQYHRPMSKPERRPDP
jgi:hypothetical protein